MQGSNEHNGQNGSGNGPDDNIVRMPTPKERRRAEKLKAAANAPAREPAINLPPVTKIILAVLIGIHIVVSVVLNPMQHYWILMHFGFVPAWYGGNMPLSWPAVVSPFTYAFLHGSWLHLGMNTVMLAAFGAGIERWMGARRMIVFMILCSLGSALAHLALNWGSDQVVVGASGAISGMFMAALMMLYERSGTMPVGRFGFLPLIAIWIIISIMFGVIGGPEGESVAWAAHVGGFLTGFLFLKPVMRLRF